MAAIELIKYQALGNDYLVLDLPGPLDELVRLMPVLCDRNRGLGSDGLLAFDPKGRFLAGAGLTDRVHVWDLTSETEVFALDGHQERINAVAFTPDGSYLLSGGDDGTVRVWDVLSGRLMVAREFDGPIQALAVSADGGTVYTGNGNTTAHGIEWAKLLDD